MIKTVIRCPDNMVMVFDENGEQIPLYQGQYKDVRRDILIYAPPTTIFLYPSDKTPELREVPIKEW
ncbi:hypothetical protein ACFLUP_04775 [Chloroflexota bacterium]